MARILSIVPGLNGWRKVCYRSRTWRNAKRREMGRDGFRSGRWFKKLCRDERPVSVIAVRANVIVETAEAALEISGPPTTTGAINGQLVPKQ